MTGVVQHGGVSNGKRGNVCNGIQVGGAAGVTHPEPFLSCSFETGIISLAFGAQCVDTFETQAFAVNGEAIMKAKSSV